VDWFDVIESSPKSAQQGELMSIRIKSRGNESAEQLMRRFKKLCEKEGLTKDIRRKEYYEKPSERRNRAKRKAAPRRP
jgi:small subunit ribosomal protein S21